MRPDGGLTDQDFSTPLASATGTYFNCVLVESAINEIVARRMIKKQQMRWNRLPARQ